MDLLEILVDLVMGCYITGTRLAADDGSVVEVLEDGVRVTVGGACEEYFLPD